MYIQAPVGTIPVSPMMYFVRGASLPASTVEPATTSWQGNAYKVGTTQTFEDFTVTFNVDVADQVHQTMTRWVHLVHNANSNLHGLPGPGGGGYMMDIYVHHLNHNTGLPINVYTLHGAWPTSVGAMALAYDTKELAQFEVTFSYQYHDILGVTG